MKKLIVAAVAATMASASMADISIKGDAYLKNLRKIAKMVLIIRVFIEKSTLFCKKNTKKYFFTTKSKTYLQYADNGIGQSGSTTVNTKRVNLNVVGKSGATTVVASFRTDDKDANRSGASNFCTSNVNSNANMCCASNMLCTLDISNSTSISSSIRSNSSSNSMQQALALMLNKK
jgi:hypothetical protein